MQDAEIVHSEKQIEELNKYLKAFDGEGMMDDGTEVYRLISGDVYPLGIGFTTNPAANVEGLIQLDNKKKEVGLEKNDSQNEEDSMAYERDKIEIDSELFLKKLIKSKKKSEAFRLQILVCIQNNFYYSKSATVNGLFTLIALTFSSTFCPPIGTDVICGNLIPLTSL